MDSDLMISIDEAIAQSENKSRSDNIKWGIKQRAARGTSKLYNRKSCEGFEMKIEVCFMSPQTNKFGGILLQEYIFAQM